MFCYQECIILIAIIDYGAGNLKSVSNALKFLKYDSVITSDSEQILSADKVILPGVGAFGDAMSELKKRNLDKTVYDVVEKGLPFLGICLGMQLLFESSEESPGTSGLGIFKGRICRMPNTNGLKIPHIGWNSIDILQNEGMFSGFATPPYVYFVHSYCLKADNLDIVACTATYGETFHAAIEYKNVHATQFHPEKSGDVGLKMLKNFIDKG